MKKKRFTEEQIIQILQEAEGGLSVTEVCRKHNCSEQSFYRWKTKYGGLPPRVYANRKLENSSFELSP